MYDIKISSPKLDTSTFPPSLYLDVVIINDTHKSLPILLYFSVYLQSASNYFNYWIPSIPGPGKSSFTQNLAFENVGFLRAAIQLKNADGLNINIECRILAESDVEIANHVISYPVDKDLWIQALHEDDKPLPTGQKANHQFDALMATRMEELENKTARDPIFQLQKSIFEYEVNEIERYLSNRPEIEQLKSFEPLIETCSAMRIEPKWSIAAALLSAFEGFMKQWLIQHADAQIEDLMKNDFDELTNKVEKTLKSKKITYSAKKFTDLAGNRRLRNRVLHEMYVPTDDEITEIKYESLAFVEYLNSLLTSRAD